MEKCSAQYFRALDTPHWWYSTVDDRDVLDL